jgi:hypothetical protein
MATLRKVLVTWNGATGLPGLSVFYTAAADDATANLGTFFTAIKALFPSSLSWSIPAAGDEISDVSGQLVGGWSGGTAASVTATGGASYAAGTGSYIQWGTATIVNGRRLKGRTFLCPLTTSTYDTDGTITAAANTTVNGALTTLVATNKLRIFHRPLVHTFTGGISDVVSSGTLSDKTASLTTRRS